METKLREETDLGEREAMSRKSAIPRPVRAIVVAIAVLAIVAVLALGSILGVRFLRGRGLGFGLWRVKHLGLAVLDRQSVVAKSNGAYTNIIFLHHSTGNNLIEQGGVRDLFAESGYDFWDHHYNPTGLRDPSGQLTGYSYRIPRDNTDPDGLARIFAQRAYPLPVNALSGLLQHEVIAFKSCFPASNITSDVQLQQYKDWYLGMRDVMDRHSDRVFVVMSPPPLNPAATTPEAAARARAFADWLTSDAYLAGHPNVFTFDFFDHLAEDDPAAPDYNMLRAEYRLEGGDSHPNQRANEAVGPAFAEAVMAAASNYAQAMGLSSLTKHDTIVACLLEILTRVYPDHGLSGILTGGGALPLVTALLITLAWGAERRCLGVGYPGRGRRGGCSPFSPSGSWPFDLLNLQSQLFYPQTHTLKLNLTNSQLVLPFSRTAFAPTFLITPTNASRCTASLSLPLTLGRRRR